MGKEILGDMQVVADGLHTLRRAMEFMQIATDEMQEINLAPYMPSMMELIKGKTIEIDQQVGAVIGQVRDR